MNIFEKGKLFKGFVVTQDKRCIEKFKGRSDFKSYDEVKSLPEFAGILEDNIILVDIDDGDESEMLFDIIKGEKINCVVMETTRGKHFYFKNNDELFSSNKTHTTLCTGITADIKLGKRTSYSVLKHNKKERKILHTAEDLDTIPFWMQTTTASSNFNLSEGDGRNQALFNYILPLQSQGMSIDEIRTIIRIINKYILKEPLSENELEVILRDDAFKRDSFFKGTKFLHDKFALFMKSNYNIIRNNGTIMIYQDGVYKCSTREIERMITKEIPSLKTSQRKEVISQLDLICDDVEQTSYNMIPFKNGILNIQNGELLPFSPNYIVTNKIDWDYNPNAYDRLTDDTLNNIACGDADIRSIIEEMIGACFYRSNTLAGGKAFILTGEGANGKSTILAIIRKILGNENYSALDLKSLDDRFSTVRIYQKLANIGDDISDEFNPDVSTFKKIVTGDSLEAEQKGQPKFEFEPYCKLIFSANNIPRMKDKTGAAQRRLLIVPFEAKFSKDDPDFDPEIRSKLSKQESIEYLIKIGIEGLQRVLQNRQFTVSEKVEKELEDYAERNNPILGFVKDCEESEIQIVNESVPAVYSKYQEYCIRNGFVPIAKNEFSKQIQRILNIETIRRRIPGYKNKVSLFVEK